MPNNYKGLNISGLKSTTKLSRVQVEPTVDFVEITDRGLLTDNPTKLRTAGSGHNKRSNASPKSTVGSAVDMGGLFEVASVYDYGAVPENTIVVDEDSRWFNRRQKMDPPPPPTTPWVNRDNWNGGTTAGYSVATGSGYGSHGAIPRTNQRVVTFNSDGSIGYIIGQSQVNAYNLSVPYDLSEDTRTNSYSSFTIANGSGLVRALEVVDNGNRVLRGGSSGVTLYKVHEKDVFTWPYETISSFNITSLSVDANSPRDFADSVASWSIAGDGTKLTAVIITNYITRDPDTDTWTRYSNNNYSTGVIVFDLTTAWDLSTATYFSHAVISNTWNYTTPKGFMAPDGLTFWLFGNLGVRIFSLATPFDISSTRTLLSTVGAAFYGETPMNISPDGRYIYGTPDQPSNGTKLNMTDFGAP